MATRAVTELPLVVVVGPTASGKTSLAIELALKFDGEIISADSRAVYTGMDIGTAKPTTEEQAQVPHWGIDIVSPGERFTAVDFKLYAVKKIDEIRARGHVPFLVGGTGLYVDAVIFDYQFGPEADFNQRASLEKMSIEELHTYCVKNNVELPENNQNKRYLIRAIERKNISTKSRVTPIENSIIVGITTDKEVLRSRIGDRAEHIFNDGVVEEATILGKKYGWDHESMTGNIYPLIHSYLENRMTFGQMKEKFTTLDWRLAKRQLTWLRRNPYIWWGSITEVREHLNQMLANE
jgi:tRNA dimethylallyltransferase